MEMAVRSMMVISPRCFCKTPPFFKNVLGTCYAFLITLIVPFQNLFNDMRRIIIFGKEFFKVSKIFHFFHFFHLAKFSYYDYLFVVNNIYYDS